LRGIGADLIGVSPFPHFSTCQEDPKAKAKDMGKKVETALYVGIAGPLLLFICCCLA